MRSTTPSGNSALAAIGRALDRWATPTLVRWLAIVATVTMYLLYATGTLVTTTGSGQGCGASWPLCRGQFIPEFAFSTAIEFTHRVTSALVTPLILATAVGVWWRWRSRLELRILVPVMLVTLFAEAGLGAALVLARQSAVLLAVHFGSSLILVASVLLIAVIASELSARDALRDRLVPKGFRILAFALAGYTYVVGYLGAYMRLRGAELGCRDWPLCNGTLVPGFTGFAGIAFTHRVAALVLIGGTLWLFVWAYRMRAARPDFYRGSVIALGLVLLQALIGALVVFTRVAQYSQLLHSGVVALLFGTLAYICLHTLPRPTGAKSREPGTAPARTVQPGVAGAKS